MNTTPAPTPTVHLDGIITNRKAAQIGGKPGWYLEITRTESGGKDRPDRKAAYPLTFRRDDCPDAGSYVECDAYLSAYTNRAGYVTLALTTYKFANVRHENPATYASKQEPAAPPAASSIKPPPPGPQPDLPATKPADEAIPF